MKQTSDFKEFIGNRISTWVLIGTALLGVFGIALAIIYVVQGSTREARETLQFVFTALLPLWGTWIGTVLAYYFSKENFEAANKSVRELVGQLNAGDKLKSVKVTEAMMPYDKIRKKELTSDEDENTFEVRKLYDELLENKIRRSLIFKDGSIVLALHKSILSEFILRTSSGTPTLGDLKKDTDKDIQNAVNNGAPTIRKDATMMDAKTLMDSLQGCQDIFVTETGKKTEKVLGWISNVDIFNHGKV
jgi:hypothetical protein